MVFEEFIRSRPRRQSSHPIAEGLSPTASSAYRIHCSITITPTASSAYRIHCSITITPTAQTINRTLR